ncbi:MAG: hypothetical protein HYZ42_13120, partial [Bacteroidetes bacterium]|nr:hypothetical protein [Bacteroidota bacterium]
MESQSEINIILIVGLMAMISPAAIIFAFLKAYRQNLLEKDAKIREIEHLKQIESFRITNEAQERERKAIAQNLHDEVIPTLSATHSSIEGHIIDAGKGKDVLPKLILDAENLRTSIGRIRTISHELALPELVNFGVINSIRIYLEKIEKAGQFAVDFSDNTNFGDKPPFSP